jgi:hypothetical protein
MPRYHQLDDHSCGFLAVLAVVHYFDPQISPAKVLSAIMPSPTSGCDQSRLLRGLEKLGIVAEYRESLGLRRLSRSLAKGRPVVVTIQPEDYVCDHWTDVRGIDRFGERILLSNYDGLDDDGSMTWKGFSDIRSPRGAGLVCERA